MPQALCGLKAVNIGDGFILRAIERLVGRFRADRLATSRAVPSPKMRASFLRSRGVILAGANQLNDRFSVWPTATAEEIRLKAWRFIPFAIGIHGARGQNEGLTPEARAQIELIHERIEFSSWRCPQTVEFLESAIPALRGRFLMTCCPVLFDLPLLDGTQFNDRARCVAVTATERDDFWAREIATLDFVARFFAKARRVLVLHQDFAQLRPPRRPDLLGAVSPTDRSWADLRRHAQSLGFEIVVPDSADRAIRFYQEVDLHFGSRLHAHLHFLSQNKRSFLTRVDARADGISRALGFPLCEPSEFERYLTFDFENIRTRAREIYRVMRQFIESLPK